MIKKSILAVLYCYTKNVKSKFQIPATKSLRIFTHTLTKTTALEYLVHSPLYSFRARAGKKKKKVYTHVNFIAKTLYVCTYEPGIKQHDRS